MIDVYARDQDGERTLLIPRDEMRDIIASLRGAQLSVLLAYWLFLADEINPTMADLAESTGYTESTVRQAWKHLKARELVGPVNRWSG